MAMEQGASERGGIVFREAESDEFGLVTSIVHEAFEPFRSLNPPSGALSETAVTLRAKTAESGAAVVGFIGGEPVAAAVYYGKRERIYFGRIAVRPAFSGKGYGKKLMAFLESAARSRGFAEAEIEVRLSVPGNLAFYTKLGYRAVEKNDYPERTDSWYVMRKPLA